jgi:Mg/Co/Ni transporter MgtE
MSGGLQPDVESGPDSVNTMAELGRELKRRRINSGFETLPELLKRIKRGNTLPRSTAYNLEAGTGKCSWASVAAYVQACGATGEEIEAWRAAHNRALWHYDKRSSSASSQPSVPTAKQLSEMGSEQAARILGDIDLVEAVLLFGRISLEQAVVLLPEINISRAVAIVAEIGRARTILMFENIEPEAGGELLAEMAAGHALELLDQLDASCAASLLAAMPRTWAARLLDAMEVDRSIRLLIEMPPAKAARLLNETTPVLEVTLVQTADARKVAKILDELDSDHVLDLLTEELSDDRAASLLTKVKEQTAGTLLNAQSDWAWNLLQKIALERLSELFGYLRDEVQARLLLEVLDSNQGAELLAKVVSEDLPYTLGHLPPERASAIVSAMGFHDAVALLAVTPRHVTVGLLNVMPKEEADELREALLPPNLAIHIAQLDPERAHFYFYSLEDQAGEILSTLDPSLATRIVTEVGDFRSMAHMLNEIDARQAANVVQSVKRWEAGAILSDMELGKAAAVLAEIDSPTTENLLRAVENPNWGEDSWPELKERRERRQKFAASLRKELRARKTIR